MSNDPHIFVPTELATLPIRTTYQDESSIFTAMQYNKPAISIADQIQLLKNRGLTINDHKSAAHFLSNISYYRLAGYWWPLQPNKENHQFKQRFKSLLVKYAIIDIAAMGFAADWENEPMFKN